MKEPRKLSEEDKTDLAQARIFESLVAHPGWRLFVERVHKLAESRHVDIARPLSQVPAGKESGVLFSVDNLLRQEADKGALYAFLLVVKIPETTIQVAQGIRSGRSIEEMEDA